MNYRDSQQNTINFEEKTIYDFGGVTVVGNFALQ
jgi:hypothetical protein